MAIACSPPRTPAPTARSAPAGPPDVATLPTTEPTPTAAPPTATPTIPVRNTPAALPTPSATPTVRLRLATNHAAVEVPWFEKVLDRFAERQPRAGVDLVNVPSGYLEQVPTWAADGALPDVLFVRPQHGAAWAYRKWLVSIDDLVARDAREIDLGDFYPPQVEELKYQGAWLALPHDYSVYGIYLRADHLAEAGVDRPRDDWTWPDLLQLARRLTRREGGQVLRWGFQWRPDYCAMPGIWYAEGGTFLDGDGRGVAVSTPENVRATQWLADLAEVEGVAPRVGDLSPGVSLFAGGRLSMEANGSWAAALYRGAAGDKARIDVAYLPRGATGHLAAHSTGGAWAIGRGVRARDLAWELVKHLSSRDSMELLVSLPVRNLPGRVSATNLWLESLRAIGVPGHPEVFPKTAVNSYPLHPVPWWLDYEDAYDELMPLVWSGRRRAADVLPELERRVNAAAARYR